MTQEERMLWYRLRKRQIGNARFRRQAPIGDYIVDFVCYEESLFVELDGGQHNADDNRRNDAERTRWLESQGFRVLRLWNFEVREDFDCVLEVIGRAIEVGHEKDSNGE